MHGLGHTLALAGHRPAVSAALLSLVLTTPSISYADTDPNSGIDLVHITHPGNAPWAGNGTPGDPALGRGSVNYEYSIGRYEVTTSQWVEFFNAAFDRPAGDRIPFVIPPAAWGAVQVSPVNPGGLRWAAAPGQAMLPVGGINWRTAAVYCNWLNSNKSPDRAGFLSGAYDVSTFGYAVTPAGNIRYFTDQLAHTPGARYWIPTFDEWIKAAHYDPDKPNPDGSSGGWWLRPNRSDAQMAYGPPGVRVQLGPGHVGPDPSGPLAQANGGWDQFNFPGFNPFSIPLGAYPDVQSPWGLLDVAGATTEWTEEALLTSDDVSPIGRLLDGSQWNSAGSVQIGDLLTNIGGEAPEAAFSDFGLRIASSVPAPGVSSLGLVFLFTHSGRGLRPGGSHATDGTPNKRGTGRARPRPH